MSLLFGCGQGEQSQLAADGSTPTGIYAIDGNHTYVTFSYMHQGLSYPLLRATDVNGELVFDASDMAASSVSIAVEVDSIRTNMDFFDKELASRKFFHADKYPYITFTTHSYEPTSDTEGKLTGFVTIRDVTRPLVLSVTLNGTAVLPQNNKPAVGFSASGTLKRADFDLDRFVPIIGNEVTVKIEAEFWLGSNEGSAAAARLAEEATANADPASLEIVTGAGG